MCVCVCVCLLRMKVFDCRFRIVGMNFRCNTYLGKQTSWQDTICGQKRTLYFHTCSSGDK